MNEQRIVGGTRTEYRGSRLGSVYEPSIWISSGEGSMAKGLSLHIGLNSVDPNHYQGWSGTLVACEADAKDMGLIAQSRGFTPKILLTKQATRDAVAKQLTSTA